MFHEGLRLCPPAAAVARIAMQDIEVDGRRVEAGTIVMVGIYALHRDPACGTTRSRSTPTDSPGKLEGPGPRRYLPFGGRPRSCIGDHFAMLEATLGLATTIWLAEIRSLDDDFPSPSVTTVAAAPIRARVAAELTYAR